MDNFTRESLAIEVDERIGGHGVVEVLMRVAEERGLAVVGHEGRARHECVAIGLLSC